MISRDDVYRIGTIGKTHGINGELVLHLEDDIFNQEDIEYIIIEIDGILVPFFIDEYRFRNDTTIIIKLKGIDSEQRARELTNCEVFFPRRLRQNSSDDISLAMLVGYKILDKTTDKVIGTVHNIDYTTINTLFEIVDNDGKEILIPIVEEFIIDIDMENNVITMALPEGMVSLN